MKSLHYFFLGLFLLSFYSCVQDKEEEGDFEFKVVLQEEPDRLNPMLSQMSVATQVESHIFLPLMEYDPGNLELEPMLVETSPSIESYDEDGKAYTFNIREEASWSDGTPVTGHDYLFTVKAALNPHTKSNAWRGFLSQIDSVAIDAKDDKRFVVFLEEAYLLSLPVTCNFSIYPKHYYDPDGYLDNYTLSDLKKDSIDGNAERFGQQFNQIVYSRDSIMGSGAYRLDSWVLGQSLSLKKKNDWWGNGILEASPDKITYLFVPDEATAITMLKSGDVDLVSSISPTVFADLKKDSAASQLEFHTPKVMQYYYLALNNQNSLLKDKRVRKALAHLLDLEKMSKVLMADLAKPIASPIHSSKTYHNSNLQPIGYDPEKARQLLFESGWSDTDGDGVLENTLNNETEELSLDILVTQKALGRNIARILKENAQEVGIEINIKGQNWGEIVRQINSQDFHIAAMATRQHPGLDDLYQSWHTASIGPDGRNITGFGTARTDSIINILRTTEDAQQRKELFLMIQEIIYEEQPMIFLFSPTETIIHRSDIEIQISSKRPGYFENTAQTK